MQSDLRRYGIYKDCFRPTINGKPNRRCIQPMAFHSASQQNLPLVPVIDKDKKAIIAIRVVDPGFFKTLDTTFGYDLEVKLNTIPSVWVCDEDVGAAVMGYKGLSEMVTDHYLRTNCFHEIPLDRIIKEAYYSGDSRQVKSGTALTVSSSAIVGQDSLFRKKTKKDLLNRSLVLVFYLQSKASVLKVSVPFTIDENLSLDKTYHEDPDEGRFQRLLALNVQTEALEKLSFADIFRILSPSTAPNWNTVKKSATCERTLLGTLKLCGNLKLIYDYENCDAELQESYKAIMFNLREICKRGFLFHVINNEFR
jgi:hypothetical protein